MSYIDTRPAASRPGSIAAVIGIHAGIGIILINGLNAVVFPQEEDDFTAIDFPTKPPEEVDDPPPPEAKTEPAEHTPVVPIPKFELKNDLEMDFEPADLPPIDDLILDPGPKAIPDPVPSPRLDPIRAKPRNNPARWVTTDDYPTSEIRRGNEGLARFRLEIAANGEVESCVITRSSGHDRLDAATCKKIERRAKFDPAKDANGKPVAGTYESSVRWTLPD